MVFLKLCSRRNVFFLEQILSADKYPSVFSCQMEATDYIKMIFPLLLFSQGHVNCPMQMVFGFVINLLSPGEQTLQDPKIY